MFSKLKQLIKRSADESVKENESDTDNGGNNELSQELNNSYPKASQSADGSSNKSKSLRTQKHQLTKQGIKRIDNIDEMYEHFGVDPAAVETCDSPDTVEQKAPLKKKHTQTKRTKNKHGVAILDGSEDLLALMSREKIGADTGDKNPGPPAKEGKPPRGNILKDKHGIPVLKDSDDYHSMFLEGEGESFAEMLEESLGDKNTRVLLDEKRDHITTRKPLTLKQKLKRYPLPQGQLDLHGYTSLKADLKADSYLRHSYHNNIGTVRVIVGKGLHSEEGAVLPDVIEERIIRLRQEKIVLSYQWENKSKSKSGAVIVYLDNLFK